MALKIGDYALCDYARNKEYTFVIVELLPNKIEGHDFAIDTVAFLSKTTMDTYRTYRRGGSLFGTFLANLKEFSLDDGKLRTSLMENLEGYILLEHVEPLKKFLRDKFYDQFGKVSKVEAVGENMKSPLTSYKPEVVFSDVHSPTAGAWIQNI